MKPDLQVLKKNPYTRWIPLIYAVVGVLVGVALMSLEVRTEYARALEAEHKSDEAQRRVMLAEEQTANLRHERKEAEGLASALKRVLLANEDRHKVDTDKLRADLKIAELNVEKAKEELALAAATAPDRRRKVKAEADEAEARVARAQAEARARLDKINQGIADATRLQTEAQKKSTDARRAATEAKQDVERAEEALLRSQAAVGTRWKVKTSGSGILTESDGRDLPFTVLLEAGDVVTVLEAPKGAARLRVRGENGDGWLLWERFSTFLEPVGNTQ
jgi:hypothetical protein